MSRTKTPTNRRRPVTKRIRSRCRDASLRLASRRCVHRSFVDIRALQHLRHSYASRTADIAAPHLLIMPQLHLDALHAAASVLRIMVTSLAARCSSNPRNAAASRVQHCLRRLSLLILSLSYSCNTTCMTCAAGAPKAPSTGRKPGTSSLELPIWQSRSVNTTYPRSCRVRRKSNIIRNGAKCW